MAKKPKQSLSSQDVRGKILALRDTLVRNLDLLERAVDEDYDRLSDYLEKYGDLYYRPAIGFDSDGTPTYGQPTQVVKEPLAGQYRATINSLLQSIRLIEADILPEDNPEGATAKSEILKDDLTAKRNAIREAFEAESKITKTPIQPTEPEVDESQVNAGPIAQEVKKLEDKPWRTQGQSKFVPKAKSTEDKILQKIQDNVEQAKEDGKNAPDFLAEAKKVEGPVGLSPALRAQLGGTSRLASLKDKYKKD